MQTSRDGMLFIAVREAIVEVAYPDGPHNFSIGCGHNSPLIKAADRWTTAQALAQLKADVVLRERDINRLLKVELKQYQYDGVMSLHYNRGNRDFPEMLDAVNRDLTAAAVLFPTLNTDSNGVFQLGLLRRRIAEQRMFMIGDYGPLNSIPWWKDNPHTTKEFEYIVQPSDLL